MKGDADGVVVVEKAVENGADRGLISGHFLDAKGLCALELLSIVWSLRVHIVGKNITLLIHSISNRAWRMVGGTQPSHAVAFRSASDCGGGGAGVKTEGVLS